MCNVVVLNRWLTTCLCCFVVLLGQRSWNDELARSNDASSQLQDRESRLRNAIQELDETRKALSEARKGADATAAELRQEREVLYESRARTSELHKLGVDMERELTAMLKGDYTNRVNVYY